MSVSSVNYHLGIDTLFYVNKTINYISKSEINIP